MVSFSTVLFLSCVALTMAHPLFFNIRVPNREGQEQPLRDGPLNQVASPSYDYGAGAAGGGTDATSEESAEVDGGAGSLGGDTEAADNDAAENEAGETEAAEAAENALPDPVEAGGNSGAAPNGVAGGPGHLAKGGDKSSSAGKNAGIAIGVIAAVGLAAGIGYFVYRKRRAAAYGARF